jgi:AraC-like DNA-binding protein
MVVGLLNRLSGWFSKRYYTRLIVFGTVTVIIVAMLLSLLSYAVTSQHLKDEVDLSSQETVSQIQMNLDSRLEFIQLALSPLLHDPDLLDAVYVKPDGPDFIKLAGIVKKLSSLTEVSPDIYSIDIYIPEQNMMLSTKDGFRQFSSDAYKDQLAAKLGWGYGRPMDSLNLLSLVKAVPLFADKPMAYLAVYMNPSFLYQSAGGLSRLGKLLVVDARGFIIVDPASGMAGTPLTSNLLSRFLNRQDQAGIVQGSGKQEVLLYADSAYNGWSVLLEIPGDSIYGYHKRLLLMYGSICGLGLLIGTLLIYVQSRRLYKPIHDLVEEVGGPASPINRGNEWQIIRNQLNWKDKQLDDLNARHRIFIREQFFLELLHGHYIAMPDENLDRQMELHGLAPGSGYCIMIVEPEQVAESNRFRVDEKSLVAMAVSSICKDILQHMQLDGQAFQELQTGRIILLLQVGQAQSSEQLEDVHNRLAESIRISVQSFLKFPVSVGIGACHDKPDGLRRSFNEAQEALQYRLARGGNRILRFDDHHGSNEKSFQYPVELEKAMLTALREGNREEALRHFDEFVRHTNASADKGEKIYQTYHMLYTALSQYYIHQSEANRERFMQLPAFAAIHNCHTIQEIRTFFVDRVLPVLFEMAEEEGMNSAARIVESVLKWLPGHLGDDLSLPQISEAFKVSPSHFSRIFSRHVGVTFVEYVAGLRVESAKRMLAETELPVQVVAREVGYTEQTFRRVFKQFVGCNPTQYRESLDKH